MIINVVNIRAQQCQTTPKNDTKNFILLCGKMKKQDTAPTLFGYWLRCTALLVTFKGKQWKEIEQKLGFIQCYICQHNNQGKAIFNENNFRS
jgi:hypothetical protein